MTESLLRRWSRRKLEVVARAEVASRDAAEVASRDAAAEVPVDGAPELPAIETLGADSDYVAFLARGVPEELRRRALRQAWATDPKIAGFRGFADYDWDCNAPGYAALLPVDDIARLCDSVLRQPAPAPGVAVRDEVAGRESADSAADGSCEERPCTTA